MWMHIKDDQPMPGSYIKILYGGRILDGLCSRSSVYVEENSSTLKYDDLECWRYKETPSS